MTYVVRYLFVVFRLKFQSDSSGKFSRECICIEKIPHRWIGKAIDLSTVVWCWWICEGIFSAASATINRIGSIIIENKRDLRFGCMYIVCTYVRTSWSGRSRRTQREKRNKVCKEHAIDTKYRRFKASIFTPFIPGCGRTDSFRNCNFELRFIRVSFLCILISFVLNAIERKWA